jgi:hypothetical protein
MAPRQRRIDNTRPSEKVQDVATVRNTIDLTAEATSLLTFAGNDTDVAAAAYADAPGIPAMLIERATGTVTEIGNCGSCSAPGRSVSPTPTRSTRSTAP